MAVRGKLLTGARHSLLRRVALIFMTAVVLTALVLALAAYFITKGDQNGRALTDALDQSRQNLTVADAMLPAEPGRADYEELMAAFAIRGDIDTLVEVGPETYRSGPNVTRAPITAELDAEIAEGNIRYQTVDVSGEATIVVGARLRSGTMTIYFFFPQGERLAALVQLRNVLIVGGTLLALLGAIVGYLVARRLLRPVRAASRAAVQMSHGDLEIRLPTGSDEFGVLAASFNDMAGNLQAKMLDLEAGQARERRFVADVTHELRTPVSALVGEASLLKLRLETDSSACSPEVRRLGILVERDITRLRQLVDDLLEISRLDASAAETVIEAVGLRPFLEQLVRAHGWSENVLVTTGDRAGAREGLRAAAAGPVANADKRRVERIVVNLVENALLHGAAPVTIQAEHGATGATGDDRLVEITVADRGRGILAAHLPYLFDRFYKADPSRASGRGSGLGLAIARGNARLMGGDISAANVPDGGALFLVTLPAADL
jgi:two-component system sensor histidine kinase MtrB